MPFHTHQRRRRAIGHRTVSWFFSDACSSTLVVRRHCLAAITCSAGGEGGCHGRHAPPYQLPPLEDAKRQYVELFGSALVMNTYLKIALLCVSLVAVGLLVLNFRTLGEVRASQAAGHPD